MGGVRREASLPGLAKRFDLSEGSSSKVRPRTFPRGCSMNTLLVDAELVSVLDLFADGVRVSCDCETLACFGDRVGVEALCG